MLENQLRKNLNKAKEIQSFVTRIEDTIAKLKKIDKDMTKVFHSNAKQKEQIIQNLNDEKATICDALYKTTEYMSNTVLNMKNSLDTVCKAVYVADGDGHVIRELPKSVDSTVQLNEYEPTKSNDNTEDCIANLQNELLQIIG